MYSNRQFSINDEVKLVDGVDRAFSDCEHGVIKSFFYAPLNDLTGVQYANIEWEDGSESAVPVGNLEHQDLSDGLFDGPLNSDCDCDDDFLGDIL